MKQSLQFLSAGLFILMSSLFLPAYAQDYPKVIEDGKIWIYAYTYFNDNKLCEQCTLGDPVEYNGKVYRSVYKNRSLFSKDLYDLPCGYLREENGKVYLATPLEETEPDLGYRYRAAGDETLIYDFTIQPGESYIISTCDSPEDTSYDFTVRLDEVRSRNIGGVERREFCYSYPDFDKFSYNFSFIEGLGPVPGTLAFPHAPMTEHVISADNDELYAIYDYNINEIIYDSHGPGENKEYTGQDFMPVLAEGLDFGYFTPGCYRDYVHYIVGDKIRIYGNDYYMIYRNGHELITFMREDKGRMDIRTWVNAESHLLNRDSPDEVSIGHHYGDYNIYDLNKETGSDICISDIVKVNGESRKRIRTTTGHDFIEGLGVVTGGVLPFPMSDAMAEEGRISYLDKITDAEGNVIFSRSQLSGIDDVVIGEEREARTEYYDLTGRRVANPGKGIYIVKDAEGVHKAIF